MPGTRSLGGERRRLEPGAGPRLTGGSRPLASLLRRCSGEMLRRRRRGERERRPDRRKRGDTGRTGPRGDELRERRRGRERPLGWPLCWPSSEEESS